MANRTSETAVKEVIATSLTTAQINAFIADANLFVTEEVVPEAAALAIAITTARLELIERYLACALIRLRDLGIKNVSWSKVSETYQVDSDVTDYLLRAAGFDPTGKIKAKFMAAPQPATFTYPFKARVGETYREDADDPVNTANDP